MQYNREMVGRERDICRGVDVDLGTAANFRTLWAREAGVTTSVPRTTLTPIPLLLRTDHAPGDDVAMTAAIYSLHRSHPGRYVTAVESKWPEVFAHNPDVVAAESIPDASWNTVQMHYPAIHQSNDRGIHFMQGWCEHLEAALGIQVPLLTNRPRLYFDDTPQPVGDYWLVCSGGKRDFTNKLWGQHNYQEVVDCLAGMSRQPIPTVKFIQVGSSVDDHPRLRGVHYMVGWTNLRGLFDLVRRSRGVLCGVSLLMHVAAALEKPTVVIAGGREPVQWNSYPKQQYLHTVGALPCSDSQGRVGGACWRSRVLPLGDGTILDEDTCQRPVDGLSECMRMIRPAEVADLIVRYDKQYE